MKSKDRIIMQNDLSVLWATMKNSLPELKNQLKEIILNNTDAEL